MAELMPQHPWAVSGWIDPATGYVVLDVRWETGDGMYFGSRGSGECVAAAWSTCLNYAVGFGVRLLLDLVDLSPWGCEMLRQRLPRAFNRVLLYDASAVFGSGYQVPARDERPQP